MISGAEGQMCKHHLLLAFSDHIVAFYLSRKLVTYENCKVKALRNLFSNADILCVAPKPVRATEAVFVVWAPIWTLRFTSGRIQDHI